MVHWWTGFLSVAVSSLLHSAHGQSGRSRAMMRNNKQLPATRRFIIKELNVSRRVEGVGEPEVVIVGLVVGGIKEDSPADRRIAKRRA